MVAEGKEADVVAVAAIEIVEDIMITIPHSSIYSRSKKKKIIINNYTFLRHDPLKKKKKKESRDPVCLRTYTSFSTYVILFL